VHGYLPDLTTWLAACDVAVVQGGLTTCMELTALRKPFVYLPLRHHFEQNFHVRRRLDQYAAGTCLDYEVTRDPDAFAGAIVAETTRDTAAYRAVETDGAQQVARLLADLL
jgi:predicted glycosyltransferase